MANCRSTAAQRRRAEAHAAAILEAAETLRRETGMGPEAMEAEDMRMNRYVCPNTIPSYSCGCGVDHCRREEVRSMMEQLVELTVCQNQLLTDLLGAVNALTAAMLSTQARS